MEYGKSKGIDTAENNECLVFHPNPGKDKPQTQTDSYCQLITQILLKSYLAVKN